MATMFADGGSRGNPGPSACAFQILDSQSQLIHEESFYLGIQTNNYAEYMGLIKGIEKARDLKLDQLHIFLDSELVVKQVHQIYRVKHPALKLLHAQVLQILPSFKVWTLEHIRREKNKVVDRLLNLCLDQQP